MNSPLATVLENLKVHGNQNSRTGFAEYWLRVTTTYGVAKATRRRANRPKQAKQTATLEEMLAFAK